MAKNPEKIKIEFLVKKQIQVKKEIVKTNFFFTKISILTKTSGFNFDQNSYTIQTI